MLVVGCCFRFWFGGFTGYGPRFKVGVGRFAEFEDNSEGLWQGLLFIDVLGEYDLFLWCVRISGFLRVFW